LLRFENEAQITCFKKALGRRYTDLIWTRYLERETKCENVKCGCTGVGNVNHCYMERETRKLLWFLRCELVIVKESSNIASRFQCAVKRESMMCEYPATVFRLERETAWVHLQSGARVSISTWKDVWSVWLAGDGSREWYKGQEFKV